MPMFSYFDPTYILVIIGAVICLIAQARVKSTFNTYSKVLSKSGMTGAQAAERMLRNAGISDVRIAKVSGSLTDHYDPRNKTVFLSEPVYDKTSVAAVGVACHECGHAIQDAEGYSFMRFRASLVPVANIGSTLAWPIIVIGIVIGGMSNFGSIGYYAIQLGIILFSLAVLFQIVTLPVELNASNRAMKAIETYGILGDDERKFTYKVLKAAAYTYIASAASSILQLLRLILLFGGKRRD